NGCVGRAWADHISADALAGELTGPGTDKGTEGRLSGAIRRIDRNSLLPGAGAINDDRTTVLHQRKGLLHGKVNAPGIYAERLVVVLGRNGGSRYRLHNSGIRKHDIQLALLGRDRLIEPVKVIWVRD